MVKKMDMESLNGQMVVNMKVTELMENMKEEEFILRVRVIKEKESGKMGI